MSEGAASQVSLQSDGIEIKPISDMNTIQKSSYHNLEERKTEVGTDKSNSENKKYNDIVNQQKLDRYICNKNATFIGIPRSLYRITREYNYETFKFYPKYECLSVGCGKIFKKSSNIKVHIMLHSGQKPYKCKICQKEFSQKGNMNKHMVGMHSQKDIEEMPIDENENSE